MFGDSSLNCAALCWPYVHQETFLRERIKVNGKTNNFGTNVAIERSKSKVVVTSEIPFSKRHDTYLNKENDFSVWCVVCVHRVVYILWLQAAGSMSVSCRFSSKRHFFPHSIFCQNSTVYKIIKSNSASTTSNFGNFSVSSYCPPLNFLPLPLVPTHALPWLLKSSYKMCTSFCHI